MSEHSPLGGHSPLRTKMRDAKINTQGQLSKSNAPVTSFQLGFFAITRLPKKGQSWKDDPRSQSLKAGGQVAREAGGWNIFIYCINMLHYNNLS